MATANGSVVTFFHAKSKSERETGNSVDSGSVNSDRSAPEAQQSEPGVDHAAAAAPEGVLGGRFMTENIDLGQQSHAASGNRERITSSSSSSSSDIIKTKLSRKRRQKRKTSMSASAASSSTSASVKSLGSGSAHRAVSAASSAPGSVPTAVLSATSSSVAGSVPSAALPAAVTCADCSSDLTDSDTEVCNICFAKKKCAGPRPEQGYFSWPFQYLKTSWFPDWVHAPEFTHYVQPEPRVKHDKIKPHQRVIHRHTDSLFSTSSGFSNFRGLLNLALILLVLSSTRLCIENFMKYGILVEPLETLKSCFLTNLDDWPNLIIICCQSIHIVVTYVLEYHLLSKGRIPERLGAVLHCVNGITQLTCPAAFVLWKHPSPFFSSLSLALVTIVFLKLISYAHTNYWCRQHKLNPSINHKRRQSYNEQAETRGDGGGVSSPDSGNRHKTPVVEYPNNLYFKDLAYFIVAPTLCYELNFPRSGRIRKRFLLKRIVEMNFLLLVAVGLVQQWIVPTINNSIKPLSELNFFKIIERLLKLSIPNHFIWLIFFYASFHSMLNVVAEVLQFGDRDFYHDWWNADSIRRFWSKWNMPVHRWAHRHVYKPMQNRGFPPFISSAVVFLLSAFFHEYLVSVPLRMFKLWAFFGMLGQLPLAMLTGNNKIHGKWGNIMVWLSLILGQPIAILAYVHDYYVINVAALAEANSTHSAAATLPLRTEL